MKRLLAWVTVGVIFGLLAVFQPGPLWAGTAGNDGVALQKYVVSKGDTLYFLSKRFQVSIAEIKKASKITSDRLTIGQVLYIPTKAAQRVERNQASAATPSRGNTEDRVGLLLPWFEVVDGLFPRGAKALVTDVDTGLTFRVYRLFGHNHADVEPLTPEDTATMLKLWGKWNWERRAVVVELAGRKVAASMAGMPHGSESIKDNDVSGHFDLHFLNSRTHGTNKVDANHQAMVKKAAGQ